MDHDLRILQFIFLPVAIVLHVTALMVLRKTNEDFVFTKIQKMFLINLSVLEIFLSISYAALKILNLYPGYRGSKTHFIMMVWEGSYLATWYMLLMLVITVDRFLAVY
eukprot:TCONS_00007125-protein